MKTPVVVQLLLPEMGGDHRLLRGPHRPRPVRSVRRDPGRNPDPRAGLRRPPLQPLPATATVRQSPRRTQRGAGAVCLSAGAPGLKPPATSAGAAGLRHPPWIVSPGFTGTVENLNPATNPRSMRPGSSTRPASGPGRRSSRAPLARRAHARNGADLSLSAASSWRIASRTSPAGQSNRSASRRCQPGDLVYRGPSPRVRGCPGLVPPGLLMGGGISACAGKPQPFTLRHDVVEVHPRVCGEAVPAGRLLSHGSGAIPACAGITGFYEARTDPVILHCRPAQASALSGSSRWASAMLAAPLSWTPQD